ncbi:tetratricopeptide repeat protein, partial [Streptomyces sp. NPDC094049]|uniref:tetratricopeptide repeat protein n=1 Tax=Streptomyces sp. NPDC094049 TaxID=3154987 RepID=UPI0033282D5F
GDPATARDLYTTLITDRTRVLGPDHENTLTSRHNHARYTGKAGDPATARDLYTTLITDRTRVLGPDHENTLTSREQRDRWAEEAAGAQ